MSSTDKGFWNLDNTNVSLTQFDNKTFSWAQQTKSEKYFSSVITFLLFATGVFGNALTLAAIFRFPKLRRCKGSWFIASLSASDLSFCVLVLPVQIGRRLKLIRFSEIPLIFCQLASYVGAASVMTSILLLLLMILNRYVVIVHYGYVQKLYGRKSLLAQVLLPWIFCWGFLSLPLLGITHPFQYDPRSDTCLESNSREGETFFRYFILTFSSSFAIIVFIAYTRIFRKVRQSRLKVESFCKDDRPKDNKSPPAISSTEMKLAKTMLITFFVWFFSYIPAEVVSIMGWEKTPRAFMGLAYVLFASAATTNFIVYALFNPEYRNAYKELLGCGNASAHRKRSVSTSTEMTTNSSV